jgi:hypothetical protein
MNLGEVEISEYSRFYNLKFIIFKWSPQKVLNENSCPKFLHDLELPYTNCLDRKKIEAGFRQIIH